MAARAYIVDIAGGTATVTVQAQGTQTLKNATFTWTPAAAGKYELSYSSTSQIGTAQPDTNVIARVSIGVLTSGGAAGVTIPIRMPIKAFQSFYVHCTGAGNLGTVTLS
jgi:hypothetical protein